jgi:CDP-diacylglycerol--glycerol-3-phosphate 3-phosphatidyltransferase
MSRRETWQTWFWAIQSLSIARVALVFGFVVLCPFPDWWPVTGTMYWCALLTDFFDGRLARARGLATKFGGALDVFGDRYFMVISCLYVGFRGVSLVPLAIILLREIYSVALRMVQIDGEGIMLQNRTLGGVIHTIVAVGASGFIACPRREPSIWFSVPFYAVASFYLFYLPYSICKSRKRIYAAIRADLDKAS